MESGTSSLLRGVWGSGANDVYAVGEGGTVLRYDGVRWYALPNPTTKTLRAVWGTDPTDVYVVGEEGSLFRYNGSAWTTLDSKTTALLIGLSGTRGGGYVFAVGTTATIVSSVH
jgi:hypothetical protein